MVAKKRPARDKTTASTMQKLSEMDRITNKLSDKKMPGDIPASEIRERFGKDPLVGGDSTFFRSDPVNSS